MANWQVYVPDRSTPFVVDRGLVPTAEEVRTSLINSGVTSISNATLTVDGDRLTFRRPAGGSKGL